jgi:murein DD-endopeptidase MepM/ murein hydrolase activator NlpD
MQALTLFPFVYALHASSACLKGKRVYSPTPGSNLFSRNPSIISVKTAFATSIALLLLLLNTASVSAQTRNRRAQSEPEGNSKRADDKKRTAARPETVRPAKSVVNYPLVRKTALTYESKPANKAVNRPVLVNEITVASSIGKESPATLPSASRAGSSSSSSAFIPSIWPVAGPLRSGFGIRGNPFGGSSREFHKGQDISAPMGTPVIATANGTVIIAGWLRGYGWVVYIDHGNGLSTRYGHLSRIDVTVGQTLKRGEQLGLVGSTGRSTGPHLHYEVRINGQPVSPLLYLPALPVPATAQREGATNAGAQR